MRLFGAKLGEVFKHQVVVDNRQRAAGVIAGQMTASAPPDGHTLLLAYHQHTVNAALNPKLPYHPVDSFTPITQLTSAGLMLVVNPSAPANNLEEFIRWTKEFKGALNFGSAGIGSGATSPASSTSSWPASRPSIFRIRARGPRWRT